MRERYTQREKERESKRDRFKERKLRKIYIYKDLKRG